MSQRIGPTPASSIRSYLRLNTPRFFTKVDRGHYVVREEAQATLAFPERSIGNRVLMPITQEAFRSGNATLIHGDCFEWLATAQTNSIEAVVTDPPYGLVEYSEDEQRKLRAGRGGVWRIPPSFDGNKRSPLPRFTVLSRDDIGELERFFFSWALLLFPVIVPGAHVIIASNPLLSFVVECGYSRRLRTARRNHSPDDDNAWRGPAESGSYRICRDQCDAAINVGAMADLPQTYRRSCAGQFAPLENRWLQASIERSAVR